MWSQGTDDRPYEPLAPIQSPINPPYETACKLKKTNLLDTSRRFGDSQTASGESSREEDAHSSPKEVSSTHPLHETSESDQETGLSLQPHEDLHSLVQKQQEEKGDQSTVSKS